LLKSRSFSLFFQILKIEGKVGKRKKHSGYFFPDFIDGGKNSRESLPIRFIFIKRTLDKNNWVSNGSIQ